jgi:hypothetical protein
MEEFMLSLSAKLLYSIAAAMLLFACPQAQSGNAANWSVQIKTSGGFTGAGNGNVVITADGKIRYDPPKLPGRASHTCEEGLAREELRAVNNAVNQSRPAGWQIAGLDVAAPDAFRYTLELRKDGKDQIYQVTWYDNTANLLPMDLKNLNAAINHAMQAVAKQCGE